VVLLVPEDDPFSRHRALADAFREKFPGLLAKKHPRSKPSLAGPRRFGKQDPLKERAQALKEELAGKVKPDAVLLAGSAADIKTLRKKLGPGEVPVLLGGPE